LTCLVIKADSYVDRQDLSAGIVLKFTGSGKSMDCVFNINKLYNPRLAGSARQQKYIKLVAKAQHHLRKSWFKHPEKRKKKFESFLKTIKQLTMKLQDLQPHDWESFDNNFPMVHFNYKYSIFLIHHTHLGTYQRHSVRPRLHPKLSS
jgi:hypothetical protein